ncbi:MAG: hypothetical protein ACTSWR_06535 [Candidatus Helarchaeota archaeon]
MTEFTEILDEIKKSKTISLNQLQELDRLFDDRFWKGLSLAIQNKVKKYIFKPSNREVWIITSKNRDYLTLDDYFCNCKDFFIKIVLKREAKYCKHLLAKFFSIAFENFETIEIDDDRYINLIEEWRSIELDP